MTDMERLKEVLQGFFDANLKTLAERGGRIDPELRDAAASKAEEVLAIADAMDVEIAGRDELDNY